MQNRIENLIKKISLSHANTREGARDITELVNIINVQENNINSMDDLKTQVVCWLWGDGLDAIVEEAIITELSTLEENVSLLEREVEDMDARVEEAYDKATEVDYRVDDMSVEGLADAVEQLRQDIDNLEISY